MDTNYCYYLLFHTYAWSYPFTYGNHAITQRYIVTELTIYNNHQHVHKIERYLDHFFSVYSEQLHHFGWVTWLRNTKTKHLHTRNIEKVMLFYSREDTGDITKGWERGMPANSYTGTIIILQLLTVYHRTRHYPLKRFSSDGFDSNIYDCGDWSGRGTVIIWCDCLSEDKAHHSALSVFAGLFKFNLSKNIKIYYK